MTGSTFKPGSSSARRGVERIVRRLVESSLVRVVEDTFPPRLRLFRTVADVVRERGVDLSGALRLARHLVENERDLAGLAFGVGGPRALDDLGSEVETRLAVGRDIASSHPGLAARLELGASVWLSVRGRASDAAAASMRAVQAATMSEDTELLARATVTRGWVEHWCRGSALDAAALHDAARLAQARGHHGLAIESLSLAAMSAADHGDAKGVQTALLRLDGIARGPLPPLAEALALGARAYALARACRFKEARDAFEPALARAVGIGAVRLWALFSRSRGMCAYEHAADVAAALEGQERALSLHRELDDRTSMPITLANRALFRFIQGFETAALEDLDEAERIIDAQGLLRAQGLVPAARGWFALASGDPEGALDVFSRSGCWREEEVPPLKPRCRTGAGLAMLMLGEDNQARMFLEQPPAESVVLRQILLVLADVLQRRPEPEVLARLGAARRAASATDSRPTHACLGLVSELVSPDGGRAIDPALDRDPMVRALRVTLERRSRRLPTRILELGPEARWVRLPGGPYLDLERRPVLMRIVALICERSQAAVGTPVSTEELAEATWPNDRSNLEALRNRTWVAINTLRKLGFQDLIRRVDGGYLLEADVQVVGGAIAPTRLRPRARQRSKSTRGEP